jgi:hypothetical protein
VDLTENKHTFAFFELYEQKHLDIVLTTNAFQATSHLQTKHIIEVALQSP